MTANNAMKAFCLAGAAVLTLSGTARPELASPGSGEQAGLVRSEFIFDTSPFPQCHASTIAQATDGTLVAAWFGGTREKHPDVGIWLSRHENGEWTPPVEVANGVQYAHAKGGKPHRYPSWNPVLFQPKQGPLMLFYKVGPNPTAWWGMLMTSDDNGMTWSLPRRLPENIDGPVKNKPIELADGTILAGSSTENEGWRVHMESTRDHGQTWTRTGPLNDGAHVSAIQPSILKLDENSLMAIGRSREGWVFTMTSTDRGKTWGAMTLGALPNPDSGTDAVTLTDGRHLMVYNHVTQEARAKLDVERRTPLNLAVSPDGKTWEAALVLESEPGEYSYPAIIQARDGLVHVTYTWRRQRIRHVVVDPGKLEPRAMPDGNWPGSP